VTVLELLQASRTELARAGWIGPFGEAIPFVHDPKKITVATAILRALGEEPDADDRLLFGAWDELERHASPRHWQETKFWESTRGREFTIEDWRRAQAFALAGSAPSILDWLSASERNVVEVLSVFNRAINRLKGEQRNG
jgi:hypothetical protein